MIDPAKPLAHYDAHIAAHRAVGQLPQLVIGGTGTKNHRSTKNVVDDRRRRREALEARLQRLGRQRARHRRRLRVRLREDLPDAYGKLRAAGVKRVLFGEFAPHNAQKLAARDAHPLRQRRRRSCARRSANVAWHAYGPGIDLAVRVKTMTRKLTHRRPKLYVTEAGYVLRHRSGHVLAASVRPAWPGGATR